MKTKKIIISVLLYFIIAIFLAALAAGNALAFSNFGLVTQFMKDESFRIEKAEDKNADTRYYKSDYKKMSELKRAEESFSEEVQSEGAVLLQNKNLPLEKNLKVTLLGSDCSADAFIIGGGGSGSVSAGGMNLKKAFEDAGYKVNPTMWDFYSGRRGRNYRSDTTNSTVGEPSVKNYGTEEINSFAEYGDVAVVFIGRAGKEDSDLARYTTEDKNKHMLEFSDSETEVLDLAMEHFDKVVVLLNTVTPMETGYLEDKDVSVLWIGGAGEYGFHAVPEILNGKRYPSGKLVDTYAYDVTASPAMQNFGNFYFTNVADERADCYYNYAEGIYVGYKYYETRYADKVTGRANTGEYVYSDEVQYPFGFGLSYTNFTYSDFSTSFDESDITLSVTVTNSGDSAGKEVVEFYMQSPYTDYDVKNKIEKSAVQLIGFRKTKELKGGESEKISITVSKECMRAYDALEAETYIVDAGDYYFTAAADCHEAVNNILAASGYTLSDGMTDEGNPEMVEKAVVDNIDATTYAVSANGCEITNQFGNADYRKYDPSFTYLSRNDWVGTFPSPLGGNGRRMVATEEILSQISTSLQVENTGAEMPVTESKNGLTLASMIGIDYDNGYWDKLLDQLSASEMMKLVGQSGYGSPAISSIGKPACVDKDGPAGISSTLIGGAGCFGYPGEILLASTWDVEMLYRFGKFIGEDSLYSGVAGWYAPAMNIHRTPFSGRNHEYYSEDGYLSGQFGAATVKGAYLKGAYCYIKHFALNDQETNRYRACTFANEQTIRELYLAPFENTVTEGKANALMVSMNRIGGIWTGAHKGLVTNVLRNEWGFLGMVITDTASSYHASMDLRAGLQAGTDMMLCATAGVWNIPSYESDAEIMSLLRNSCHRILYVIADSNAMNGIAATDKIVPITPRWVYLIIAIDAVAVIGCGTGAFFITKKILLRKDKAQK